MIRIALDGMGGDKAPQEVVRGALLAASGDTRILLVGDQETLERELGDRKDHPHITIVHAPERIGMEEDPARAVRGKPDSSMVVAANLVRDGKADALVSAGSTGAQLAASVFCIGRIPGVKRPAICLHFPTPKGMKILLDAGANPSATPEHLEQFALMGSVYARSVLQIGEPRVGLISNGTEEKKGTETVQQAHERLRDHPGIRFAGNIEGKDIPTGDVDVMVCDGFTGNVILKFAEGLSGTLFAMIREAVTATWYRKLGALLIRGGFREIRRSMDSSEYGGAPLLGVRGVSMICHGASDARAIQSAVRAARKETEARYVEEIRERLQPKGSEGEDA